MIKLTTRQIALTSLFASFYYLFSILPGIPAPGIADIRIQIEACMATVFGIILGPLLGAAATFLGVFIAWILPPGNMSPAGLFFLPATVINAAVSGLLFNRQWKVAAMMLGGLILTFWITPPIQPISQFWNVGIAVVWDKVIALLLIGIVIFLSRRKKRNIDHNSLQTSQFTKPWMISLASIISSTLVLGNNMLIATSGKAITLEYHDLSITFGYQSIINSLNGFNFVWGVVGIVALLASILLWMKPEQQRIWAVIATLCSLISVITGGGFIAGVIIAVIISSIVLFGDTVYSRVITRPEMVQLFIIAFIGNEADNMWGSLIFAFPFVYESIYSLNVEVVRWLFLVSPFAYPAIRFLQAIIATAVTVPLLRTLQSLKYLPNVPDEN
ncbi:MAG: hypothetical protein JSV76_04010 [Candidatus Bathyarchaeota archaeon]|nr:MAG: hypothetical protein JSV76_04010 [Candidatus Bathyarchaeota archaeon]